jgi:uncharacterized protein YbbC (DUF1343 family)
MKTASRIMLASAVPAMLVLLSMAASAGRIKAYFQMDKKISVSTSEKNDMIPSVVLGNERIFDDYFWLIQGKRIGLVTNQTGVDRNGELTWQKLAARNDLKLAALYVPEHGLDGKAAAGAYVSSYIHSDLKIPVFSLYNDTRMPTPDMLKDIDILLFDIQDIGSRSYTYISTLNYVMKAAAANDIPVAVLDRPNPVGDKVEGFVLDPAMKSFVGIDVIPLAHGMTVGELARFFNRETGAALTIVPMKNYWRDMVFQETGLPWVKTSPNIPDVESAFCYMATGMGDGTGVYMGDYFKWFGVRNLVDNEELSALLNNAGLEGVVFKAETRDGVRGVRLIITDFRAFNPCRSSVYILSYAQALAGCRAPSAGATLFEKVWGTNRMADMYNQRIPPEEIIASWQEETVRFMTERQAYLIYQARPAEEPQVQKPNN